MMSSDPLRSLVQTGLLKAEPADPAEIDGLLRSGRARLADSANTTLSRESRFDLAYNAAHALALAALRLCGYRAAKRYVVFQSLEHSLGLPRSVWRVLDKCHRLRNAVEYEGEAELDDILLRDLLAAAEQVDAAIRRRAGGSG